MLQFGEMTLIIMVEEDKGDKSSGNNSDSKESDIWVMSERFFEILSAFCFFFSRAVVNS